MIVFPEKDVAIITPPHTASRNIHRGLGTEGYWVIGEDPFVKDSVNHHSAKVHDAWGRASRAKNETFRVYVVCRNPYTRLVGLFLHYEWSQSKGLVRDYLCWEEFVYSRDSLNWMFNKTIADFVRAAKIEGYETIKYENLEEELSKTLETKVSLPSKYHDLIKFEEWYYDPKLLKHVNETWASEDCKMFNYPIIT